MAARKLQAEIDRVLKKVAEGVDAFNGTYEKMEAATQVTQKEKAEADLKTQIKKLQRLRDQIKTWAASNDIKDKSQLMDNRRLIETQMERFKACEKEMKTKAFSKEGLIQASRLDPKAQEKLRITQWLQSKVEEILLQVEQSEAEIETLQGGTKKKKSNAASSRLEELERQNERRKWHVGRLEIILRLIENGSLSVEKVENIKDDVQYFIDNNIDGDNYEEDEGIYDDFNLDEEEEKFGLVADEHDSDGASEDESEDVPPRTPSKRLDDESPTNHKREEHSPVLRKAGVAPNLRKTSNSEAKPPPPLASSAQPMSSVLKNGLPPRPPAALPVRYAAAAAAAVAGSPSTSSATAITNGATPTQTKPSQPVTSSSNGQSSSTTQQSIHDAASSSPSLTQASASGPSPMLSSASVSGAPPEGSTFSPTESPAISEAVPPSVDVSLDTSSPQHRDTGSELAPQATTTSTTVSNASESQPIPSAPVPEAPSQLSAASVTAAVEQANALGTGSQQAFKKASSPLPLAVPQTPASGSTLGTEQSIQASTMNAQIPPQRIASASPSVQQGSQGQPRSNASAFPGSLSDLVASFENVKQRAPHRMNNLDQVHKLLEGGYSSLPQPLDTEKPKYYVPKNAYPTPPYYPQTVHPILSSPTLFQNLDIETLFYVFYYLPGTYQQFLAAKELKRQSWRFHVKYLTWFQRHSEPQAITDEYEQGVYVYFDWEGSWCQRKKSDFRFEYRYLSED